MKKLILLILIVLAACQGVSTRVVVVPTLAVLPSATSTALPTLTQTSLPTTTPLPTQTAPPTGTPVPTDTPALTFTPPPTLTQTSMPITAPLPTLTPAPTDMPPSLTATPLPTLTLTLTPTDIPTDTPTITPTYSYTPSQTITDTITPTASPTFTASPELDGLGMLALLSERATILPAETLYNPQTLTAVAYAAQTLVAATAAPPPALTTAVSGEPELATLPPPNMACASPPPGGLSAALASDPSLAQAVGCPLGQLMTTTTAVQLFEHGSMIYVQGSPGAIYMLTLDGRFRRYDDTWVSGVDPETGGETPPLGLIEPKRGFGKVWRNNPDVRATLGWGVTEEQGATSPVQPFDRGRAVFLPQRGETYLLLDDPGGATGSWRSLPISF